MVNNRRSGSRLRQPTRFSSDVVDENFDQEAVVDNAPSKQGTQAHMVAVVEQTPQFRAAQSSNNMRQRGELLCSSKFKSDENEEMASCSSDKKRFSSVKRKLEYNSPLKDSQLLLHNLQRGPSLEVHLPAPRLVVVGEKSVSVVPNVLEPTTMKMETDYENIKDDLRQQPSESEPLLFGQKRLFQNRSNNLLQQFEEKCTTSVPV